MEAQFLCANNLPAGPIDGKTGACKIGVCRWRMEHLAAGGRRVAIDNGEDAGLINLWEISAPVVGFSSTGRRMALAAVFVDTDRSRVASMPPSYTGQPLENNRTDGGCRAVPGPRAAHGKRERGVPSGPWQRFAPIEDVNDHDGAGGGTAERARDENAYNTDWQAAQWGA